jgi:hypothetical protein
MLADNPDLAWSLVVSAYLDEEINLVRRLVWLLLFNETAVSSRMTGMRANWRRD